MALTPTPLTPAEWQRLSALFDEAIALPPARRRVWLATQPDLTSEQRDWLGQMLDAHATQGEDDWLERGPQWPAGLAGLANAQLDAEAQGLSAGARVGPWVLHELLGAGGMATVWRATRADALPAREVALKLPLLHRSGSQLAERFAREREILARLSHPHIAPLYAAGVAPDGTPWLAMELVQGETLPQWCDARALGITERLALFQQVLDAVAYAHAQLVIHRDLKPSNILVTPEGQVRLLDFGIAKLLDADTATAGAAGQAPAAADLTQAAQPFTPAYAAPEQLSGQPLTTATDVYALGVVLFELLTGTRPYRFAAGTTLPTAAQTELAILDGQTLRASTALTTAAAATRGASLARLRRQLRGDLDTILAKALKHAPRERYASVAEFGDDLHRWLDHAPVRARPDSRRYRLGRFVRRYRVPVAAGAVVMLSLAAALTVSLVQVHRADRQRDLALAQRGQGTAIRIFLMDQLVVLAREGRVPDLPALLDRTEASARAAFARDPDELALALLIIGGQRRNFDGPERALPGLTEALAIASDPNLRAEISCDQAAALYSLGRRAEALAQVRRASADTRLIAGSRAVCLDYQVLLELAEGDLEAALRSETVSVAMASTAPDMPRRGQDRARMVLAYLQAMTGGNADPDPVFQAMLTDLRAADRERSLTGLELKSRWASVKLAMGDARRALALIDENRRGSLGPPASPALPSFLRTEALTLEALGRDAEALTMFDDAARLASQAQDPRLATAAGCLAVPVALRLGSGASARSRLTAALASLPAGLSATDEPLRACSMAQAELALADGAAAQVGPLLAPLLDETRLTLPQRASALLLRARAALALGDAARAKVDAGAALDITRRMQGALPASFRTAAALAAQGDVSAAQGDRAQARTLWRAAEAQFSATVDAGHPALLRLHARLGEP
jgi:serine/threonine-protein kinase